jgi:hypothetical protein
MRVAAMAIGDGGCRTEGFENESKGNMRHMTHFTHEPVLLDIVQLRLLIVKFRREKVNDGGT